MAKKSQSCGRVRIGDCLYNVCYVQIVLCCPNIPKWYTASSWHVFECMLCCRNKNQYNNNNTNQPPVQTTKAVLSLKVGGKPLKQSEKFKYVEVSFTSDGRQTSKLKMCIGQASAIMRQLRLSVVLKRELCTDAKLSIFRPVYVPILTYGHQCWIMNEKVTSPVQGAEMGLSC